MSKNTNTKATKKAQETTAAVAAENTEVKSAADAKPAEAAKPANPAIPAKVEEAAAVAAENTEVVEADVTETALDAPEVKIDTQSMSGEYQYIGVRYPTAIAFDIPGKRIVIPGNNQKLKGQKDAGIIDNDDIQYAKVSTEDWKKVIEIYGSMRHFKRGLFVFRNDLASVKSEATEMLEIKHGKETKDPKKMGVEKADKE